MRHARVHTRMNRALLLLLLILPAFAADKAAALDLLIARYLEPGSLKRDHGHLFSITKRAFPLLIHAILELK